ncbi:MAG: hypothetical protein OJJ54_13490 [Pseudonocardia sp.]|nr:hypothetical protein [Pseudonocardia sp.]
MGVDVANLTQGPGTLYRGAVGATEPLDTALATAPSGPAWTDVGGTMDGVTLTINQEYSELQVDQVVDVPGRRISKRDMTIATNMAEPTLENLAFCLNQGTISAGTGYKAIVPPNDTSATQPTYSALIFDGFSPSSLKRRIVVRRALSTNNVEFAYKKDAQTVFTATFSAHFVSSSIPAFRISDEVAVEETP